MTLAFPTLRKNVAILMMALLAVQPAIAQTLQYRITIGDVPDRLAPKPGTGLGDVDTGGNPEEAAPPQLTVSPATLQFDSLPQAAPATRTALVTNTGTVPTMVTGIASSSEFSVTHNCPASLPVDASCEIRATPSAPGTVRYDMPVTAPGSTSQAVLTLTTYERSSEAPAAKLVFSDDMVALGTLKPGESATASTQLSNVGSAAALLGGFTSKAGFSVVEDCPDLLEVGASCTVTATFSSFEAKTHSHSMALSTGQPGPTTPVTFYAEVKGDPAILPALELDRSALIFGPLEPGAAETKKAVLTNTGTAPAMLSGIEATSPFSLTSGCPAMLAVGASCDILVTFNAFTQGSSPAQQLTIKAQDGVSTRLLLQGQVNGTDSTAPKLVFAPANLDFGDVAVGESSSLESVVTNEGGSAAAVTGVKVDYGSAMFSQTHDCPASLAVGASCRVNVTFKATEAISRAGRLAVTLSKGPVGTLALYGRGEQAQLRVGPLEVDFGAMTLPGTSTARTVSLSNSGNEPLTGLAIANSNARLNIGYGTCTDKLQPKKSCSLTLSYAPAATGSFAGEFTVSSANGGTAAVTWKGTALKLTAAPSALSFDSTRVGASAADQTATLTNNGTQALQLGAVGIISGSAHFGQSNNCGASLPAGESCSVLVRYTPSTARSHSGEVGVTVQGALVARIALAGMGIEPKLLLSKASLQFAPTNVGQNSEVLSFNLSNPSPLPVTFIGMGITEGASEFAQSNNCGTSLAPGASCTVSVQLTPVSKNVSSGTWAVESSLGVQYVTLTGQGTAPAGSIDGDVGTPTTPGSGGTGTGPVDDGFTHYAITFLDTEVGASSAIRNVKFTNKGDGPLTVLGVSIASGETDFAQSNNCGGTLAPGAYCTLSLQFTPSALAARTGGIALLSDGGKFYFDLSGKGIGAVGTWRADSSADFGFIGVNAKASRSFTLSNTGMIPAKQVMTQVIGQDLLITANTCGTLENPAPMPVGGSCRITVEYAPTAVGKLEGAMLQATGTLANGPVRLSLAGTSPAPGLAVDAAPTGDFGSITVGTPVSRTYYLRNVGKLADTLASLEVNGSGFTLTGGTCKPGLAMPVNSACTATVSVSAPAPGTQDGSLRALTNQGSGVSLPLLAQAIQSEYAISGSGASMTAPVRDYGTLTADSASATRTFYLRDVASVATITANNISLASDGSFAIVSVYRILPAGTNQGLCATTATALTAPCSMPAAGYSVGVTVKFAPQGVGLKTGTLRFDHNGTGGSSEIELTGTGAFNANAVWSSTWTSLTPPPVAFKSFGTNTLGTTTTKVVHLRNVGTYGAQAVGLTLSGDTSQFQIVSVIRHEQNYSGNDSTQQCAAGGVVAPDRLSSTPCLAADISLANRQHNGVLITLSYKPTSSGNHSLTITPTTNNGTSLPEPLVLTGTGAFNPTMAWSMAQTSLTAPTAGTQSYGIRTLNTTLVKSVYMRNVGTNGAQATGVVLTGDTNHFRITSVYRVRQNWAGNQDRSACSPGGAIAADKLSVTPCGTEDVALLSPDSGVVITVTYTPTEKGEHRVTLTPTTSNGTVLPAPLELYGEGEFNPTAAWSSSATSLVAPTAATLSYGTRTTNTVLDKTIYVSNPGTHGAQSVGFTLSGDTSHFQLTQVRRVRNASDTYACNAGGVISAGVTSTPCLADDKALTGWVYPGLHLVVRYNPTSVGEHSITITPNSNNGTVLPTPITLTGTGAFNPVGVWSTSQAALVAPTSATLSFGARATGTVLDKTVFVRNMGTHGAQAVGFTLAGDTSQFKLVKVAVARQDLASTAGTCLAGGVIAATGLEATPCLAADRAGSTSTSAGVNVTLRYAPTAAGTHSLTVTPTTNNGTGLPESITFSGSAP